LLPELQLGLDASRQRLLRGDGNDQLDASSSERTSTSFGTPERQLRDRLLGWPARRPRQRPAQPRRQPLRPPDRRTDLVSAVADSYLQGLALEEQLRIARLNLDNARDVLGLVEARERAGSATRLELAQQRSLVAAQSASCRCSNSAARTTASPWPPCWVIRCRHCPLATR
jgi:outer membrane protein TolC